MSKTQKGFSLIEILLVITIIGVISVISIPWLQRAISTDKKEEVYKSIKFVSSIQLNYFAKHNRYARLDELHSDVGNSLGTLKGSTIQRGDFTLTMSSADLSDEDLKTDYQIIATKKNSNSKTPCVLMLESSGTITEVYGEHCFSDN